MRPIDADEAHSKLTELYKNAKGEARKAYSAAIDIISDADTIEKPLTIPDVERVLNEATVFSVCFHERITLREFMNRVQKGECKTHRHGAWEIGLFNPNYFYCSECGLASTRKSNYCPECGSHMIKTGGGAENAGTDL